MENSKNFDGQAVMIKMAEKVAEKKKKKSFKRNTVPWTEDDLLLLHLHVARVTPRHFKEFRSISRYLGVCSPLRKKFSAKTISCKWSNLRDREENSTSQELHEYLVKIKTGIKNVENPFLQQLIIHKNIKTPILLKEEVVEVKPMEKPVEKLTIVKEEISIVPIIKKNSKSKLLNFLIVLSETKCTSLEIENITETETGITIGKISLLF
jgi:hypothetical protein